MTLRQQAEAIWRSGVAAVDSETLVRQSIQRQDDRIAICGESFQIDSLQRIVVVGAGKAGAGMAAGVEASLSPRCAASAALSWAASDSFSAVVAASLLARTSALVELLAAVSALELRSAARRVFSSRMRS